MAGHIVARRPCERRAYNRRHWFKMFSRAPKGQDEVWVRIRGDDDFSGIPAPVALPAQNRYRIRGSRAHSATDTTKTAAATFGGVRHMRTLQARRPLAYAALVLLGLNLAFSAVFASDRRAGNSRANDNLTRYEIAAWHDKLYDSTNAFGAPGGGSSALRGWAMMALSMFEASNTIDRIYAAYAVQPASIPASINLKIASKRVAVAKAAQVVLDGLFAPPPGQTPSARANLRRFAHATQFAMHTAAFDAKSPAYTNGVALGSFVGEQILKKRADDGHPPTDTKVENGVRWDRYQYGLAYFPGEPQSSGYTKVRPFGVPAFGLQGGEVTFVAPPLRNDSAEFKTQWEELFRYGTADAARSARTAATDATARFHDGNFGSQIGNTIDVLTSADIHQSGTELFADYRAHRDVHPRCPCQPLVLEILLFVWPPDHAISPGANRRTQRARRLA